MMTKDYVKAAEIVRSIGTETGSKGREVTAVINAFIALFSADNPRFNEQLFRQSCKIQS
jgi:hypothetical protein